MGQSCWSLQYPYQGSVPVERSAECVVWDPRQVEAWPNTALLALDKPGMGFSLPSHMHCLTLVLHAHRHLHGLLHSRFEGEDTEGSCLLWLKKNDSSSLSGSLCWEVSWYFFTASFLFSDNKWSWIWKGKSIPMLNMQHLWKQWLSHLQAQHSSATLLEADCCTGAYSLWQHGYLQYIFYWPRQKLLFG